MYNLNINNSATKTNIAQTQARNFQKLFSKSCCDYTQLNKNSTLGKNNFN